MPRGEIVEGVGHLQEQFGFGLADVRQRLLSATLSFFLEVVTLHTSYPREEALLLWSTWGGERSRAVVPFAALEEMGLVEPPNLIN